LPIALRIRRSRFHLLRWRSDPASRISHLNRPASYRLVFLPLQGTFVCECQIQGRVRALTVRHVPCHNLSRAGTNSPEYCVGFRHADAALAARLASAWFTLDIGG
jgi:hypothetical protein